MLLRQVAVARALGGSEWRGAGISDAADVSTLRLSPSDRVLVLASDGVWGPLATRPAHWPGGPRAS